MEIITRIGTVSNVSYDNNTEQYSFSLKSRTEKTFWLSVLILILTRR